MPTNPNWPFVVTQFSTSVPFDGSTPSWVDISSRIRGAQSAYGRQYELDVIQTGECTFTVDNKDEYLNPTNPSSPYYPNIKPYRQITDQAMWPPTPVGSAVNLLNTSTVPTSVDPTFESYAVGATPAWLTAVGGASPTVQAANPWQGTQSLQWTLAGGSTQQGISVPVTCIPGQQYTASGYIRQSSASTQMVTTDAVVPVNDGFNRTVSGGWGTADSGQTWAVDGTASQFTVSGGVGVHSVNAVSTLFRSRLTGPVFADADLKFSTLVGSAATGNYIRSEAVVRFVDASNYYVLRAHRQTTGSIDLQLIKLVGGVESTLASITSPVPAVPGQSVWVRMQAVGTTVRARIWLDGAAEPTTWAVSATDTSFATGTIAVASLLGPGNTNTLPLSISYDNVTVTGTTPGTSTTTTGAYVRLSATFTATQPTHNVRFVTAGAVAAGTANFDAIQLEPGASASTFASSGPVIYTAFAGYVERWPESWQYQGTFGSSSLTCVDAMGTLTGLMHTEYRNAVLATNPTYYWPLSDSGGTSFGEISGNNGPPMLRVDSVDGPGDTFNAGAQIAVAGDPGGTGLACSTNASVNVNQSCIRASGRNSYNTPPFSFPGNGTAMTAAFWAIHSLSDSGYAGTLLYLATDRSPFLRVLADNTSTAKLSVQANGPWSGFFDTLTVSDLYSGSQPHLYVIVVIGPADPGAQGIYLYVDGVNVGTLSLAHTQDGPWTAQYLDVGGHIDVRTGQTLTDQSAKGATYAHVSLWNRALTSTEISTLWQAGQGYNGERSGARVARFLTSGGYRGSTAIDQGQSTMGVSTVANDQVLLDACQQVAISENGTFYAEAGALTFKSRTDRYLETVAKWVFGERADLGELPYESDIAFDFDPTRIVNDVRITRSGGITATVVDQTSVNSYLRHTYERTIGVQSDNEAVDAANYLLARNKQPVQRVSRLTINPAANPSLWPVALGARLGDRVTVKRRTAAGYTMSADYFVERVEQNRAPGSWTTSFQMSPAQNVQVWILQDSASGLLDTTTVLSY